MKQRLYLFIALHFLFTDNFFGQNPNIDPSWNVYFQDDFNSQSTLTTLWNWHYPWTSCIGESATTNLSQNRKVNNGYLELTILKQPTTCQNYVSGVIENKEYSTGAIYSKARYKYGYFETKFRLKQPQSDGEVEGLGPNFWLFPFGDGVHDAYDPEFSNTRYSEIDIVELMRSKFTYTFNMHSKIDTAAPKFTSSFTLNPYDPITVWTSDFKRSKELDFNQEHTFACEWSPNYVIYYLDNQQIQITDYPLVKNLIEMNIILDINLPTNSQMPGPSTVFPFKLMVDYVKVYKLKLDCSNSVMPADFNYSTFDHTVKKSITLGQQTGQMQPGQSIALRARDFVQMVDGFEVPIGADFYANNYECDCNIIQSE